MEQQQTYKVLGVTFLTESAYKLRLERGDLKFIPGQCVNIGLVGQAVNREYSTYSGVKDPYLEFLIKRVDGGLVSTRLSLLDPGDEVTLDGAYGLFTLKNPGRGKKYLFISSGTGIAPFHSFVKSYDLDYHILHGIRSTRETYDLQDYERKRYISCVSREDGGDFRGRVTDYLKKHPVKPGTICYICGNSSMINDVYDLLRSQGVSGTDIFTEVFF